MKSDLSPEAVGRRLARLRTLYVPDLLADARARETATPRPAPTLSADAVARRLSELRALCELTTYLHRRG